MSYVTYTTAALVCGSYNRHTADRSFRLFTRELGMLFADARSVREERSRQRYALQDFSRINVSLVKGKAGWRVGSVEIIENDFMGASERVTRGSVVKLYRLLRRYIHGEQPQPELFTFCVSALEALPALASSDAALVDLVIEARILYHLGYVDAEVLPEVVRQGHLSEIIKAAEPDFIPRLAAIITAAHHSSQL